MRLTIMVAIATLPLAAPAAAAPEKDVLYTACQYQTNEGINPFTALFVVAPKALEDGYGEFTYEKNKSWEELVATDSPYAVRNVSGYYDRSLVGQFVKFAESKGDSHGYCWVTTERERAFRWYRGQLVIKGRPADPNAIRDWRPTAGSFLRIEDWPPM